MPHELFAIGIPTINRADLLIPTIKKYSESFLKTDETDIYIVDNGKQNLREIDVSVYPMSFYVKFIRPTMNLGVAMSWNMLCSMIFDKGYEYAVILNDDIRLQYGYNEIANYLKDAGKRKVLFATHGSGMCAFIIHRDVFKNVGFFDPMFSPAYFEDNDYLYRLKLAHVDIEQPECLRADMIVHSASSEKDPSLKDRFLINQSLYEFKWGGLPNNEKYKLPYEGNKKVF